MVAICTTLFRTEPAKSVLKEPSAHPAQSSSSHRASRAYERVVKHCEDYYHQTPTNPTDFMDIISACRL